MQVTVITDDSNRESRLGGFKQVDKGKDMGGFRQMAVDNLHIPWEVSDKLLGGITHSSGRYQTSPWEVLDKCSLLEGSQGKAHRGFRQLGY